VKVKKPQLSMSSTSEVKYERFKHKKIIHQIGFGLLHPKSLTYIWLFDTSDKRFF
jgi:hypothetical protein